MIIYPFEADVCPETQRPRLRMSFDNGWTISIVLCDANRSRTGFHGASVAAWPTRRKGTATELLDHEADADRVAAAIADVRSRASAPRRAAKPATEEAVS